MIMFDLKEISGLPIALSEDGLLQTDIYIPNPALRTVGDLLPVLYEKENLDSSKIAYYMYRNVHFTSDASLFKENGIRYDLTVIFPGLLNGEFIKTLGHYHSRVEFSPYTYPEIYEVVFGEAVFLLQKKNGNSITDVIYVRAKPGDKLIVPPDYGHVTINIGSTILVTSNLMAQSATSDHREYLEKKGANYYLLSKEGELVFNLNHRYGNDIPIREVKPSTTVDLCFSPTEPLYKSFLKNPTKFKYLTNPQECGDLLERYFKQGNK